MNQWHCGAQGDATDVIHRKSLQALHFMQGVDIDVVFYFLHDCFGLASGMTNDQFRSMWHGLAGEPANHRFHILFDRWRVVFLHDHIAARDIDFIF